MKVLRKLAPAAVAEEPEVRQSLPAGELRRPPSDLVMPEVPVEVERRAGEEGREEEPIQFSGVKLRMVRFTSMYETNRLLSATTGHPGPPSKIWHRGSDVFQRAQSD